MAEPREPLEVRVDDEARRPGSATASARSGRAARRRRRNTRERARRRRAAPAAARACPRGSSRLAVRGLRASIPASIRRFSAIASERAPTIATVIQTRSCRARHPVDREKRADVGERQREDRVLDLDERREARRVDGDGACRHVCRCAVVLVGEQPQRVLERGLEHREPVAAAAGRAGQVDDERRADGRRRRRARAARAASSRSSPPGSPRRSRAPRDRARAASPRGSRRAARARCRRSSARAAPPPASSRDRRRDLRPARRGRRGASTSKPSAASSSASSVAALVLARRPRRRRPRPSARRPSHGSFVFSSRRTSSIDHLLVDRLRHVVDRERGDRRCGQRLHLDARLRRRLDRRGDLDATSSPTSSSTLDVRSGSGWQSGISSLVRFAAMIPATCAVASASPFGSSRRRRAVSGAIRTAARATARRRESGFAADVDHPDVARSRRHARGRPSPAIATSAALVGRRRGRGRSSCALDPRRDVVRADVLADRLGPRAPLARRGISSAAWSASAWPSTSNGFDRERPRRRAPRARRRSRRGRARRRAR